MSDELPDWLDEFSESTPDDEHSRDPDPPTRQTTTSTTTHLLKNLPLTSTQLMVLGGLAVILCFVCSGITGIILVNGNALFGSPSQSVAVAPPPEASLTTPEPSPTSTETPLPTATLALVEATATPEPTATATYAVAPEFINKDKIANIIEFVEDTRELALPENVPIQFLTRHQLQDQWRDESFDAATLEAVQTQQDFYLALGLIEPQVDLVEAAFASQTNILLGYYTPEEKVMYIIAESVNMFAEEEMTFAHEYVHALQDHHFDLTTIFSDEASGDLLLASRSLPEGDARLVEDFFTMENIDQTQLDYTVYRYLLQEHPQIEGVSPALGVFTYFPYTAGEYFVLYLFFEGGFSWDKVNQAYQNPPISSEQVMHPEKYLAGEAPVPVPLSDLAPILGGTWHQIDRDVLGEAGFLVWLIDQVDPQTAIDAAAGWNGDTYTLWKDETNRLVLVESSVWESETDAVQFFEAFRVYMNQREGEDRGFEEGGTHYWEFEGGAIYLGRQGHKINIIIAPDRATLDTIRTQFAQF